MYNFNLILKLIIILTIVSVISADVCDSVSQLCDCFIEEHGELGTEYQLNCTSVQNGENKFNVNTKLTYPPTLDIDCIQFNPLVALPALNINDKFATVKFVNCFNNDTIHANYKFKFFEFARKILSVGFWSKIDIRFNIMGKVDEDMFFGNWNYPRLTHIYIENIFFETSAIFKKRNNIRMFSLANTHQIDMDTFNENSPMLRNLDLQASTIKHFTKSNLKKIKNLESLRIINCGIANYYDQMYLEGSIFESNTKLISVTLEKVYDDNGKIIKLNGTIFNNVQLTTVQLVDLKLERLPPKIFWSLNKLSYLVLHNNRLDYLDPHIFTYCPMLKFIDLSNNNFIKFTDTRIFSNILPLQELHLSFNQITSFGYDASGQDHLEKIQLDHNKIKLSTILCPIINVRNQDAAIDMSFNKIYTATAALDCVLKNDLKLLNMSNNQISELNFTKMYAKPTPLSTELDFRNNKIISIDVLSMDDDSWNPNAYPYHNINLHIDQNPIFCQNCRNIKRIFEKDYLFVRLINGSIIKIIHPHECRASVFFPVHQYFNPDYKCPKPCQCSYNEFSQHLSIDCHNRNLTEIPYLNATDLFELNITRLNLDLSNNFIRIISFRDSAPKDSDDLMYPVINTIGTLDLDNNLIEHLNFMPFEFPANLETLRLKSNRISHIDDETLELLNSRNNLLAVALDDNTLTKDLTSYADFKKRFKFILIEKEVEEEVEDIDNEIDKNKNDDEVEETKLIRTKPIYMIWLVLPVVVICLIVIGYVFRRSGVGRLFRDKEIRNRE